jgi:hypothetical protein
MVKNGNLKQEQVYELQRLYAFKSGLTFKVIVHFQRLNLGLVYTLDLLNVLIVFLKVIIGGRGRSWRW